MSSFRQVHRGASRVLALFALTALFSHSVRADEPSIVDPDIAGASIEQLLDLKITAVSQIPQTLKQAPAAVTVLTAEDIRRSGARSIPEALRLVPGVHVARMDANKWSVTIRGFNDRTANKLLVMVDGRSIYNPLLSGTIWETKDVFLEDVERIEVVRGPGGSAWGSNAVNGVINIITKSSKETTGGLIVAGGGTEERTFTDARYGAAFGDNTYGRIFGKYYDRDNGYLPEGVSDDEHRGNIGFRLDDVRRDQKVTLQGFYDRGDHDGVRPFFTDVNSRDLVLQGQMEKTFSGQSSLTVNGYYARTDIHSQLIGEDRSTGELNVAHIWSFHPDFSILSGMQYRLTKDEIFNSPVVTLEPDERTDSLYSAFLQGRAVLVPEQLRLTLGARVERNDYSSFEVQPDIAVSWSPTMDQVFWGSIARAVRIPSRLENDVIISQPTGEVIGTGNRYLESETLIAYQIGYRRTLSTTSVLDLTGFYNVYDELVVFNGTQLDNRGQGSTYGIEAAPSWQATDALKLSAGYSLFLSDLDPEPGADANVAASVKTIDGKSPEHQFFVRSSIELRPDVSFDFDVRYVDSLTDKQVPAYTVGDARLAWRPRRGLELAVIGQNLFRAHHFEQGRPDASEVQQGVYGQIAWTF